MPPAVWLAVLPLTVELVSVNMYCCRWWRAAAVGAELPLMVQPVSVAVPEVARPPPCWLAVLPLKVEFVNVIEPCPPTVQAGAEFGRVTADRAVSSVTAPLPL